VVCGEVHLQTYLLGLFDQDLPFSIKFYEEPLFSLDDFSKKMK